VFAIAPLDRDRARQDPTYRDSARLSAIEARFHAMHAPADVTTGLRALELSLRSSAACSLRNASAASALQTAASGDDLRLAGSPFGDSRRTSQNPPDDTCGPGRDDQLPDLAFEEKD
jgi:hypothetical protein